jgi:hypothetical protein
VLTVLKAENLRAGLLIKLNDGTLKVGIRKEIFLEITGGRQ